MDSSHGTPHAPRINKLIPFNDGMLNLIQNIEVKKCKFQNEINSDIKNKIKKPSKLLIPADKTTNYYTMTPTYKKSSDSVANKLDMQSASIAKRGIYYLESSQTSIQ